MSGQGQKTFKASPVVLDQRLGRRLPGRTRQRTLPVKQSLEAVDLNPWIGIVQKGDPIRR